jgi:hypothetical protein
MTPGPERPSIADLCRAIGLLDVERAMIRLPPRRLIRRAIRVAERPESQDLLAILVTNAPQAERLSAAARFLRRVGPPVHRERWKRMAPGLRVLAAQSGRSPGEEIRALALGRIFEAVEIAAGELTAREYYAVDRGEPYGRRAIRRALARLICADLAGPGWRRREREAPLIEVADSGLDPEAPPSVADPDRLALAFRLASPREGALLSRLAAGFTLEEAAGELGIAIETARVMVHRVRRKLGVA